MTITIPGLLLVMNESTVRSRTPEPPYMWQSKEALRQIERTYDDLAITRLAIDAYNAASRIASDKESETFECNVKDIAKYMHCSHSSAKQGIRLAEAAGVIHIQRRKVSGTKENAPSIYTLLQFKNTRQGGVGQILTEVGQEVKKASLAETLEVTSEVTAEETKNDSSNGSKNRPSRPLSARIQLVSKEHIAELKLIYQPCDVDKAVADCQAWLLTPRGKGKAFTKRRLQTFLRDAEPLSEQKPKGGGQAATWIDSNKAPTPPEQPISLEEQREMAEAFVRLRKQMQV